MCVPSRFLRDIDSRFLEAVSADRPASRVSDKPTVSEATHQIAASPRRLTRIEPTTHTAAQTDYSNLQIDMRVWHERFGEGVIRAFEGEGNNRKAVVDFDKCGQKQLLLKFARLKVIE